jgi:hypothetical protein
MTHETTRASRRIAPAIAAAALFAACAAHAGTIQPEVGGGYGQGTAIAGTQDTVLLHLGVAYHFDNGLGARILWFADLDPFQALTFTDDPLRTFSSFAGLQLVDQIPLAEQWNVTVGAGMGRTRYNMVNTGEQAASETDGVATVGCNGSPRGTTR